ncbi:AraC family transcriptional regulator [Paenibacillus rhizoplanae]
MRPIDIGELASKSGMAINTFHRQFKRATGLSPIQFQKAIKAPGGQKPHCLRGLSSSKCCISCWLSKSLTV